MHDRVDRDQSAGDRRQPARRVGGRGAFDRADPRLPRELVFVAPSDSGHWVQQERPAEINAALLEFLATLRS
jgi:pimeloyl-ACP methyl ester carboxylesterase